MHTTIVVHVEDKPGVLARVASQFRRMLFNIESMAAGASAPGITAITIAVDDEKGNVDRLVGSLSKLVNVLQVEVHRGPPAQAQGDDTIMRQEP